MRIDREWWESGFWLVVWLTVIVSSPEMRFLLVDCSPFGCFLPRRWVGNAFFSQLRCHRLRLSPALFHSSAASGDHCRCAASARHSALRSLFAHSTSADAGDCYIPIKSRESKLTIGLPILYGWLSFQFTVFIASLFIECYLLFWWLNGVSVQLSTIFYEASNQDEQGRFILITFKISVNNPPAYSLL